MTASTSISDDLDHKFREAVFKVMGCRRGALKEAIELRLKKHGTSIG